MPYAPSRSSRRLLRRFETRGKLKSLIRPEHKPVLEYIFDRLCLAAVPCAAYLWYIGDGRAAVAVIAGAIVLWTIRELFIQDDHALVRIYGPAGRLRYVFERVLRDK